MGLGLGVYLFRRGRERGELELERSEARFRGVFEVGVVGMAVLDGDHTVVCANDALGELLATSPAALVGRPWLALLAPGARVPTRDGMAATAQRLLAGETPVDVEVASRPILGPDGQVEHHVVLVSDVRERRRDERERLESQRLTDAVIQSVAAIAAHPGMAAGDLPAIAAQLTELAAAVLAVERASVWVLDGDVLRCVDLFQRSSRTHEHGASLPRYTFEAEFQELERRGHVDASDALTDPRVAGYVEAYTRPLGITSMLDVCVRGSGQALGTVCLEHVAHPHTWSQREIVFARQLADQVALVILQGQAQLACARERSARSDAEAANRAKSDFLAATSHEIRTPMNGVVGFAELLLQSNLDADQREMVNTIRSSGQALLTVVNDVLDLSKIDAGKLELDGSAFDLRGLLQEVIRIVPPLSPDVRTYVELHPELPAFVAGDAGRLRQILINLMGNAHKFTRAGHVRLSAEPAEHDLVRFAVVDTGIGIPEAQQARLFGRFEQADATSRNYGGTGLGLAISKRLAELMGGQIGFESATNQGSTFWFTARLPTTAAPVAPGPREAIICGPVHALVAEDNLTNQRLIRRMLERLGCTVDVVGDGRAAVSAWAAGRYDVVFMDCLMPEMDGLAAAREIRQQESATGRAHTPVLALTASALDSDRDACFAAGMDAFITKPLSMRALALALETRAEVGARHSASGPRLTFAPSV